MKTKSNDKRNQQSTNKTNVSKKDSGVTKETNFKNSSIETETKSTGTTKRK